MNVRILIFGFFTLLSFLPPCYAQPVIQWASAVEYTQNHFSEKGDWSAEKTLGKPDALPQGQLSPRAFKLKDRAAFGTLILTFQNPIEIDFIIICENFLPGRITEIYLFEEEGSRHPAYRSNGSSFTESFRVLSINIPHTKFKVKKIEVNINSISNPGWCQIDAIGISSAPVTLIKNEIESLGFINFYEEFGFIESKERLGNTINTPYDENKPVISPDGSVLYFIRNNYPSNIGGKRDLQDIYISDLINGQWRLARNAGSSLNNKLPNGVSSLSTDGNIIYLMNNYQSGAKGPGGISYSYKTTKGWSVPEAVQMEHYYNRNEFEDHQVAAGGRILISSLERDDSYGDLDLYISFLEDGSNWSIPINLGPVINSPKMDYAPFLASDGKTLYFSSNGHRGFGRSDIYFTRRLDESWMNWSEPQNMGSMVNSRTTDAYYTVSARGDYGYFVSRSGAQNGSKDIFRIKLPMGVAPEPVLLIKGKVLDKKTNKPLGAKIYFETLSDDFDEGTALANPLTGEYTMVLSRGKVYGFRAVMNGYLSVNENIDLAQLSEYHELIRDLYLVPIEEGQVVQLNNLFFRQSLAQLKTESFIELERWVRILTDNPEMVIELQGHTDNQGSPGANQKLSLERVGTIKKYLVVRGIDQNRIKIRGFGDSQPLNDNSTEMLRSMNRRVELVIVSL